MISQGQSGGLWTRQAVCFTILGCIVCCTILYYSSYSRVCCIVPRVEVMSFISPIPSLPWLPLGNSVMLLSYCVTCEASKLLHGRKESPVRNPFSSFLPSVGKKEEAVPRDLGVVWSPFHSGGPFIVLRPKEWTDDSRMRGKNEIQNSLKKLLLKMKFKILLRNL